MDKPKIAKRLLLKNWADVWRRKLWTCWLVLIAPPVTWSEQLQIKENYLILPYGWLELKSGKLKILELFLHR